MVKHHKGLIDNTPYHTNTTYGKAYTQPFFYGLPTDCIPHIPAIQTELEQNILNRFNWTYFVYQFPPYLQLTTKTRTQYNTESQTLEDIKIFTPSPGRPNIFPNSMPKNMQHELTNRFHEYREKLGFPPELRKQFPFMYSIFKDMFLTNLLNARNHKKIKKNHLSLLSILTKGVTLLVKLYQILRKHWQTTLATAEDTQIIKDVEAFLGPILDPNLDPVGKADSRVLLIPIREKTE